eukprot:CAMPEP_0206051356 /NCGR_PEP_ID=MMETSP1466-20131121/31290_1 /ASSEMBLY_ACC=CAM_ASM_001126 /TAXON_ID=44452 /ORGANISM="Pavlova gyrans, Strain CCMP608" /LENGTH=290 /DNA_ID=CAMNT_0053426485 /DNA_START=24 /DNA_END=896 /DNA_ORIENTATION=+
MSSQFASRADTREDGYSAARRGEGGKEEGFHAEDNPALMNMIERTQQAQMSQARGDKGLTGDDLTGAAQDKRLWYEVTARGGVDFAIGDVSNAEDGATHLDEVADDDLEALRALRLSQIKQRAQRADQWRALGHGKYTELHSDREFFEEVARHERAVCALYDPNAQLDTSVVHGALGRIAPVHLETKLCCIAADKAPMLCMHVDVERLPVLFLLRDGKMVEHICVDRTFTTEGVAYELADKGFLDSDETIAHRTDKQGQQGKSSVRSNGPAATALAGRVPEGSDDDDDEY